MKEKERLSKFIQAFHVSCGRASYNIYPQFANDNFELIIKVFKQLYKVDFPDDKKILYRNVYKDWFQAVSNKAKNNSIEGYFNIRLRVKED